MKDSIIPSYMLVPTEEPEFPCCPVCGGTLYEELYFDINDSICGCSECVSKKDASEYWEAEWQNRKELYEDRVYEEWKDRQCGL